MHKQSSVDRAREAMAEPLSPLLDSTLLRPVAFSEGKRMPRQVLKTGSEAMLGTRYTSRPYTSLAGLRRALLPFMHLGEWQVLRETGWSRSGRARPQYVGFVRDSMAASVLPGILGGDA